MKVLFDHLVFQLQQVGGVSRALVEMMHHLPPEIQVEIAIKESDNVYLQESDRFRQSLSPVTSDFSTFFCGTDFPGKSRLYHFLVEHRLIRSKEVVNLQYCQERMLAGDYDVFQLTHYNSFFLPYNRKPFVLIVHDIIPELFPSYYPRHFRDAVEREKLIPLADHIVVISQNTRADVQRRWQIPDGRLSVIHWGAPDVSACVFHRLVSGPYLLYVGGRRTYKRFPFFVHEAAEFLRRHSDVQVVCTGLPFTVDELSLFHELGLASRFHAMMVSTADLYSLYHYALCFVYPSLYEGFGLPILEAMACGCPVLLSPTSCFPEIGGDSAFYFQVDSQGHSDLSHQLESVFQLSDDARKRLALQCCQRASLFSWEETARQYAAVYESLC